MKLAALIAAMSLPFGVTVSPNDGRVAWFDGSTQQVWVARADGTGTHKVGQPWPAGIGQVTWTQHGLLVDSNYTLFLLTQSGARVKIGVVGDQWFSVGGIRAASGSAPCGYCRGPVTVYNIRTHTAVRLGDRNKPNTDAALSPDGARVAYSADGELVVQPVTGGAAHSLGVTGGCAAWSPSGRTLAFYHLNILETIAATGGKPTVLLRRAVCHGGMFPAWSPDSQTVAIPYGPDRLALVNARTRAVRKTPISLGRMTSFTWSPDGTSLVATFRRGDCGSVLRLAVRTLAPATLVPGCP